LTASEGSAEFQPLVPSATLLLEPSHDHCVVQGIPVDRHSAFRKKNDKPDLKDMLKVNV
jgi:hypothetical protein